MNNDEKILQMLEQMNDRMSKLEQGQQATNKRIDLLQDSMDERFDTVDEKLEHLKSSVDYAAKDARTSIARHEKEFHNVG